MNLDDLLKNSGIQSIDDPIKQGLVLMALLHDIYLTTSDMRLREEIDKYFLNQVRLINNPPNGKV